MTMTMNLFTSNFARHGKFPQAVAITVRPPLFIPGIRWCQDLAPTWKMVDEYKRGFITEEQYRQRYLLRLNQKQPEEVLAQLREGDILMCYEKAGDFCHRHIAAEWLMQVPGVTIVELPE